MKIGIHDIPEEGLIWVEEVDPNQFPMIREIAEKDEIRFISHVYIHIEVVPQYGLFDLQGRVKTTISAQCGRCLEWFDIPLDGKVAVTFAQELPEVEDTTGEGVELSADDMGILLLEEPVLDLSHIVEEQILLELPYFPLCSAGCKGICFTCGTNLNTQTCSCQIQTTDPRWDALRQLKRH